MTSPATPNRIYAANSDFIDIDVLPYKDGINAFEKDRRVNQFVQFFNKNPKVVAARGGAGLAEDGFAAHHIIPLQFVKPQVPGRKNAVYEMMKTLTAQGLFSVVDGHQNLMWLPNN
jgi:hypothetical protein